MTIPRLTDVIRAMVPQWRGVQLTRDEQQLATFLRGNDPLLSSLVGIITSRIQSRANAPVPSTLVDCKAILDRDNELRWLLSRLDFIYRSPVAQPVQDDGEPPA